MCYYQPQQVPLLCNFDCFAHIIYAPQISTYQNTAKLLTQLYINEKKIKFGLKIYLLFCIRLCLFFKLKIQIHSSSKISELLSYIYAILYKAVSMM